jgi:hypothetical protein
VLQCHCVASFTFAQRVCFGLLNPWLLALVVAMRDVYYHMQPAGFGCAQYSAVTVTACCPCCLPVSTGGNHMPVLQVCFGPHLALGRTLLGAFHLQIALLACATQACLLCAQPRFLFQCLLALRPLVCQCGYAVASSHQMCRPELGRVYCTLLAVLTCRMDVRSRSHYVCMLISRPFCGWLRVTDVHMPCSGPVLVLL